MSLQTEMEWEGLMSILLNILSTYASILKYFQLKIEQIEI